MLNVAFNSDAFSDYNNWAETDKQVFKRLVAIITDCQRSPFKGIGKPETPNERLLVKTNHR